MPYFIKRFRALRSKHMLRSVCFLWKRHSKVETVFHLLINASWLKIANFSSFCFFFCACSKLTTRDVNWRIKNSSTSKLSIQKKWLKTAKNWNIICFVFIMSTVKSTPEQINFVKIGFEFVLKTLPKHKITLIALPNLLMHVNVYFYTPNLHYNHDYFKVCTIWMSPENKQTNKLRELKVHSAFWCIQKTCWSCWLINYFIRTGEIVLLLNLNKKKCQQSDLHCNQVLYKSLSSMESAVCSTWAKNIGAALEIAPNVLKYKI